MNRRNGRRLVLGLGLESLEGRIAPSGGLREHPAGHLREAEVRHNRATEDKPGHHAAEDNHVRTATAAHANDDRAITGRKGGRDDGPAHR